MYYHSSPRANENKRYIASLMYYRHSLHVDNIKHTVLLRFILRLIKYNTQVIPQYSGQMTDMEHDLAQISGTSNFCNC